MSDINNMSENNETYDAFEILNSEFANHDLEKQNIRNLETLRRKQAAQQQQNAPAAQVNQMNRDDFFIEDEEEEKSGCVGTAVRILLILALAAAVAWMVFMPQGSLKELWNHITPRIQNVSSWVEGFFSGKPEISQPGFNVSRSDVSQTSDFTETDVIDDTPANVSSDAGSVASDETPDSEPSDSPYSITVYRPSQLVIVYDTAGNPAKVFSCSSGKDSTPTRLGNYAIRAKYRWRFMVGNCYTQYASSFSNSYLFHSIPYNKKNPATMSNASYDKLGNPASSGCIRLCFRDTKWIYDNCPIGTKVSVIDEKAPAGSVPEIIPERIKDSDHSGWDPTDDSPDSPYNK